MHRHRQVTKEGPEIPPLGMYLKNPEPRSERPHTALCLPGVSYTLWGQPGCPPVDGRMKRLPFVCMQESDSAVRTNGILPAAATGAGRAGAVLSAARRRAECCVVVPTKRPLDVEGKERNA